MKAENKRALIIFGDMTGFAVWARRSTTDDFLSLMQKVYTIFGEVQRDGRLWVKCFGDGFMAVKILEKDFDQKILVDIFKLVLGTSDRIEKSIRKTPSPRPQGFRIRAVIGPVWNIKFDRSNEDFLGYFVNLASRLLGVARDVKFLVSESVKESFRHAKASEFVFSQHDYQEERSPRGIDPEDLKLWIVRYVKKRKGRASLRSHR